MCVHVPTRNTISHDNHKTINSWVSFVSLYGYGGPFVGLWAAGALLLQCQKSVDHAVNVP